jgi:phosphoribosyl 1,2-cyclic phosphate phosphodiesterase
VFSYVWDKSTPKGGGLPQLRLLEVTGRFCLGTTVVVPVPILHGSLPILGYRFDRFAYLTDCSAIPETSWPLLEGVEVLVLGALRHRPHPTHFSLSEAVEVAARIGAAQTYFTHMGHELPHAETCVTLPPGVTLAHDGLTVEV